MNKQALRILLVSSRPPEHSANLGGDIVNALQTKGCTVDFLSLYPSIRHNPFTVYTVLNKQPESASVELRKKLSPVFYKIIKTFLEPLRSSFRATVNFFSKSRRLAYFRHQSGFLYVDETSPDIDTALLLSSLPQNQQYDLIITLFWQNMLNTTSLRAFYDRYKAPVYIYSVDMAPMTGGCYYFNTCDRYKYGCGQCPCLLSNNIDDRSHHNYLIKKDNYSKIEAYFLGNTWMIERAIASRLFDSNAVLNMGIIIDETIFYPKKSAQARLNLGLPQQCDLILLARSSYDRRKGSDILVFAMEYLWRHMPEEYKQRLCLVTIGDSTLENKLKGKELPVVHLGLVDRKKLINIYRESTLFLNPSTDDAGPSMVNQSIMCGTPVVSFNLGTAVDVIEDGISGFKTEDISKEGFAHVLKKAIDSILNNLCPQIRETTREMALKHNTSQIFAEKLMNHYNSRC